MFKLLKRGECYAPKFLGKKDILVAFNKIYKIDENIATDNLIDVEIIDCTDKIICPGFIDQHLHITGGGGEEGFVSRIPEIKFSDILTAGITTVVGLLGFDSITRNVEGLLAKARALETEGLNTYIYTGSYGIPTATITGKVIGKATAAEIYVNTERMEGSINSEGSVKIGLGTVVIGDILGTSAVIAGAVKGDIDVNGPVVIDSTAIIKGNIKAKSLQINNGAVVDGFCSLTYSDVNLDNIFE